MIIAVLIAVEEGGESLFCFSSFPEFGDEDGFSPEVCEIYFAFWGIK